MHSFTAHRAGGESGLTSGASLFLTRADISHRARTIMIIITLLLLWSGAAAALEAQPGKAGGLGRAATPEEIAAWDIDVPPGGEGLPPGEGTVQRGRQIFQMKCAVCHGPTGREGPMDRLVGGQGTLSSDKPVKTVGSYWPYATTLFDYIRRAMPFTAPQSLAPDEVYSLVAWLLYANGIAPEDSVMSARTLPAVRMPNRDGFVPDPRPDVPQP